MRGKADWSVLEDREVRIVAQKVAKVICVGNEGPGLMDKAEIEQEALILIATTPDLIAHAKTKNYGYLYHELRCDVSDKFLRPLLRSGEMEARKYRTVTLGEIQEDEPDLPAYTFDDGTNDYTTDMVTFLLPAVWDESYAYGLPDKADAPDRDMPRSAGNKARQNTHWAYIADIKRAWERTPLTLNERRALVLSFGLSWNQTEIAAHEGVSRRPIAKRIEHGIAKMTAFLNGAIIRADEEGSGN